MTGKVYIVGAGPGAADLLTLRAASVLRVGEIVLHDDLVSQEILELIPRGVQVINVGKRCGRHGNSQDQINALMVEYARDGKRVVRLKSGDPAVFGRLGEELEALREADVPFEIVPGVTAAAAAAASAIITLTDRRAASALVLLTAHRCGNAPITLPAVDPENTTFAVYMPGPNYGRSAQDLIDIGLLPETPCTLVSHAGRKTEQVRTATLGSLQSLADVPAPAVLIVGEVVRASISTTAIPPVEHSSVL
jgi:uroporphyrin-III C-methyltransferase